MARMTQGELPPESKFMTEFWKMIKEFYNPEDSDQYWEGVLARARQIDKDCNSRMGQHLMNAYLDYLEEKQRGGFQPQRKMPSGGGSSDNASR